jgi:integrase
MNVYGYQSGKGKRKWRFDKRINGQRIAAKGFRTRKAALKALEARVAEIPKTDTGFLKLCERYLDYAEARFTRRTYTGKRSAIRGFLSHYGQTVYPQPRNILAYLQSRSAEVSANAYNADRKELSAMFSWGLRYGYATHNPVATVEKLGWRQSTRYVPPYQDINAVLLVAGVHRDLLDAIRFSLARKSEMLRLTWEDVDFERNTIRLWTRKRKDGADEYDELPMSKPLRKLLMGRSHSKTHHRWVFPNPCGQHQRRNSSAMGRYVSLSKLMPRLCAKAGVKPFGFHALRHYGASYLQRRGETIDVISKLLRHKNRGTTEIYLHTLSEDVRRGAEVLGEMGEENEISQNMGNAKQEHI